MSEQSKDIYGLESSASHVPLAGGSEAGSASASPRMGRPIGSSPRIEPAKDIEPLPLEEDVPLSQRPIKDLDVCPNCGASMGATGEIVCLRCGFDLKTMRTLEVQTGEVEIPEPGADDPESRKPLVVDGRGGLILPLILAAAIGVVLLAAYAFGVRGLFLPALESAPTFGQRLLGMLKLVVTTALLTGCGIGALTFVAYLNGQRLGDLRLAAARMLGIIAVTQLVTLMDFRGNATEFTVESIVQIACFAGLSIVFFGIKPRDVPTLLGATVILYVLVQLAAWLITVLAG